MEFFAAIPVSMMMPINAGMDSDLPVTSSRKKAPPNDTGSAARMVIGWKKLLNSRTSTTYISRMPVTMAKAKPMPSSWKLSASPDGFWLTPCGRDLMAGRAFTACVPWLRVRPVSSAVMLATRSRSRRLIWLGPAPKVMSATADRGTVAPDAVGT